MGGLGNWECSDINLEEVNWLKALEIMGEETGKLSSNSYRLSVVTIRKKNVLMKISKDEITA